MSKSMFATVVSEFAGAFTRGKRDSGKEFWKLKDDAPTWLKSDDAGIRVMRDVHYAVDRRAPDDWIYEHTSRICDALDEYKGADGFEDADAARAAVNEIAEGLVDVYTAELTAWLAQHLGNVALCDEAVAESCDGEDLDTVTRIMRGQSLALERITNAVIDACETEASDRDEVEVDPIIDTPPDAKEGV